MPASDLKGANPIDRASILTRIKVAPNTFQRARTGAEKQQRRDVILSAARELGRRRGVRYVTLGDVASEAGLAKSSVLRYFETREEIYLQITADCWHDWSQAARARLLRTVCEPDRVADVLTQTLSETPLFCDLLAHTQANLEHNVSTHAVRTLRAGAWAAIEALASGIRVCLPALDEAAAADVVLLTSMIAGAIWQRANPPPSLAASFQHDPDLRGTFLEFGPSMREVLRTLIQGVISGQSQRILAYLPPTVAGPRSKQRTVPSGSP